MTAMNPSPLARSSQVSQYRPFLKQVMALFEKMDARYQKTADLYGFHCQGCEDNCCLTRFHHHTHLEHLLLSNGLEELDASARDRIRARAESYYGQMIQADERNGPFREMCPLNSNGLCTLYLQRPMICRLHGIPHELVRPGRRTGYGPGCAEFDSLCGNRPYINFDRTPFYMEMATLEKRFKAFIGVSRGIKMTVAEMILRQPFDI